MINKASFFTEYRVMLDKTLTHQEVKAIDVFINLVDKNWAFFDLNQWAYVFATTYHETGSTFEPIEEANWLSLSVRIKYFRDMYDPILGKNASRRNMALANGNTKKFDGEKYFGRGLVQLTWKNNYYKYSIILGEDFINKPEMVCVPEYAFKILTHGFNTGAFTGKKISDYINSKSKDYKGARRCINGTDKDILIANYATEFERILKKASQIK